MQDEALLRCSSPCIVPQEQASQGHTADAADLHPAPRRNPALHCVTDRGRTAGQGRQWLRNVRADTSTTVSSSIKAVAALPCWKSAVLYPVALLQTSFSLGRWQHSEKLQWLDTKPPSHLSPSSDEHAASLSQQHEQCLTFALLTVHHHQYFATVSIRQMISAWEGAVW